MRNQLGFSLLAAALLSPVALGQSSNLDSIRIPAASESEVNTTYKAGKGLNFKSENFDFWLQVYGATDMIWTDVDKGGQDTLTFAHPFVRVNTWGSLWDDMTSFKLQWDPYNDGGATKNGPLKDFWIKRVVFKNDDMSVSIRAGQGKTYHGREFMASAAKRNFIRSSIASATFSDSRTAGGLAMLHANNLSAWLGAWNTSTAKGSSLSAEEGANGDNELDWSAGFRYDVNGPFSYSMGDIARSENWNASVGGGVWLGNTDNGQGAGARDNEVFAWNINGAYKNKGMSAQFDVFSHTSEVDGTSGEADNMGWTLQGGYITAEGWGFAGRISAISMDPAVGAAATAGANVIGTASTLGGAKGDVFEYSINGTRYFNGMAHKVQAEICMQDIDFDAAGATDASNLIFALRIMLSM